MRVSLRHRLGFIVWASAIVSGAVVMAAPAPPTSRIDIEAEAKQPAGTPVLMTLIFTNISKQPFYYWSGGPGRYPDTRYFAVAVVDDNGKVQRLPLSNGQANGMSGIHMAINPGQSARLPAALPPLPPGSYTIRHQGGPGKAAKLTVSEDKSLLQARAKDIQTRVRKGEPFAQHVASAFPHLSITELLIQDLQSAEQQTALQAALTLWQFEKVPRDSRSAIVKALRRQMDLEKKRQYDYGVLVYLPAVAGKVGSEEALDAVLALARSDFGGETRRAAVNCLSLFQQERLPRELRGFLKDNDDRVRFEAAWQLARRKDRAALEVLLAVAKDGKNPNCGGALRALYNFADDPRVEKAVRKRMEDPNDPCYGDAKIVLEWLRPSKKK